MSAKKTFEAKTFASQTFACGTFRGVGAAAVVVGRWANPIRIASSNSRIEIASSNQRMELRCQQ